MLLAPACSLTAQFPMPPPRASLERSATWPPAIRKLAAEFLCSPVRVTIGSQDLAASHSVKQASPPHRAPGCSARLHRALRCARGGGRLAGTS